MDASINGNNRGNDNTGYNVPFELAFEISAAIIVITAESPKLPNVITTEKEAKSLIFKSVINM